MTTQWKGRNRRVLYSLFIVSVFGLALFQSMLTGREKIEQPLQVTVTTDQNVYQVGESIALKVCLENVSKAVTTVNKHWYNPNTNTLEIFGPDGEQILSNVAWEMAPPSRESFVTLAPDQVFCDRFEITEEQYGKLDPGSYKIRVRYENQYDEYFAKDYPNKKLGKIDAWTGELYSETVQVKVVN